MGRSLCYYFESQLAIVRVSLEPALLYGQNGFHPLIKTATSCNYEKNVRWSQHFFELINYNIEDTILFLR